jgi:hypothetical protein
MNETIASYTPESEILIKNEDLKFADSTGVISQSTGSIGMHKLAKQEYLAGKHAEIFNHDTGPMQAKIDKLNSDKGCTIL